MKHTFKVDIATGNGVKFSDILTAGLAEAAEFYDVSPSVLTWGEMTTTKEGSAHYTMFNVYYQGVNPGERPKMSLKPSTLGESNEFPG